MLSTVISDLKNKYPEDLVDVLIQSYLELKNNYANSKFKMSELEGGFFVECIRRIIEIDLFGNYIPIGRNLNSFNDQEMKRYESANGDDAIRLHIPRVLRSVYNLRNKRGVGHLSKVSPNIIDCTYIVSACNWVLAELIRQSSAMPPDKCQAVIDSLVQRTLPIIFIDGDMQRVLDRRQSARNQVLILLYHNNEPIKDNQLMKWIEYSNSSVFKKTVLRILHEDRLIEYRKDGFCVLTPKGIEHVEKRILQSLS